MCQQQTVTQQVAAVSAGRFTTYKILGFSWALLCRARTRQYGHYFS